MNSGNKSIYHERNLLQKEKMVEEQKTKKKKRRYGLMMMVLILCFFSMINIVSASFFINDNYMKKHGIFLGLFLFIYIFLGSLNYKKFNYSILENKRLRKWLMWGSSGVLVLVGVIGKYNLFPRIVPRINGAYGWVRIAGINLQPAEILKIPFVIVMAITLANCEREESDQNEILVQSIATLCIFIPGLVIQNDIGTALHYGAIWAFMVFMSNIGRNFILKIMGIGIPVGIFITGIVYKFGPSENTGHIIKRIKSYVDILFFNRFDQEVGYQVKQSILAFGSGGLLGKGYANGVQKYSYLPEIHTDFVMATFAEEFGFVGIIGIVLLFYFIFISIMHTSMETKDEFGKYLAMGIGGLIMIQMFINIFVAVGLLPVFGIPMPLFSYGGSSMVTLGIALGIIQNINKVG